MISRLSALLAQKQISCTELTQCYLDAIARENPAQNAYITVTPETALAAARAVDARIAAGLPLRPLEGIPMTLKDNISTKGIETTCASKLLRGYRPSYDATAWALLQAQGAVLLGKTNLDEFAMGSSGESSCYGGTANPRNPAYVTGGSSSGGAAAVGSGLAAYALGSDTGGSVRQPAAFCGLVGLKPTYGSYSRFGLVAHASSLDQLGSITDCVEDAAQIYDIIARHDPLDATSRTDMSPIGGQLHRSLAGLTIGLPEECFTGLAPSVERALQNALQTYSHLGARLLPLSLPILSHALPTYFILSCAESASNLSRFDSIRYGFSKINDPIDDSKKISIESHIGFNPLHIHPENFTSPDDLICRTRSEGFGAEVKRRILLGNYLLRSEHYEAYYKKAQLLRGRLTLALASCDLLLTPTAPTTAFLRGLPHGDPTADDRRDICTVPASLAGLPAISIPCGKDADGLPIGLQLVGRAMGEGLLLAAAYAYERETGGGAPVWPKGLCLGKGKCDHV